ncbi:MAG: prolyl oligopeptidase family serine peptidase [Bacteroidales bacterium]|jgi:dipeptidyl aminopeptidase/acylaminoacyl peptidase|nr:prolyl oligopeptidase family serine peptidase [Bacteroidales bacterium]
MKIKILSFALLMLVFWGHAQEGKKPLDFSVYDSWNYIENKGISNDGKWVFYESNPYHGDGKTVLYNTQTGEKTTINRAKDARFSPNDDYLVYKIYPYTDTVRALKLKKTDPEKIPEDSLGILVFEKNEIITFENLKSFDLPDRNSSWLAFLQTTKEANDTIKTEKKKKYDKKAPQDYLLTIINPATNKKFQYQNVTEFSISENGQLISFIRLQNDTLLKSTLFTFNTEKEQLDSLEMQPGLSKKLSADYEGNYIAFIHTQDTVETKVYSLYFYRPAKNQLQRIADTLTPEIPEKWTVSEHGDIYFSENNQRLFFGIAPKPKPEPEDTLLDEEKVVLDLWSWTDPLLQPQQLSNLDRELNRTYLGVYHIKNQNVVQLEDKKIKRIKQNKNGNGEIALGYYDEPYHKRTSWELPAYSDIYIININTGEKRLFKEKFKGELSLSPDNQYIFWYAYADSSWHSYSVKNKISRNLTAKLPVKFYDEEFDYPMDPDSYGIAGWIQEDAAVLIYDRYDIWKIDPEMKKSPTNITNQWGRNHTIRFRYVHLDEEKEFIHPRQDLLLKSFNFENKQSGFFTCPVNGTSNPKELVMDDVYYYHPEKARDAQKIIWQRSSFEEYYDLWVSNTDFTDIQKISLENPQQANYLWGDVELYSWITADGTEEEGLLYKPENFDPEKKYPMIVYFYRLHSNDLHRHYVPKPSRSIINPTFYTSNGYFVFMPNIRYKTGYPGESAYNYVVSGTLALLNERSYLDREGVGIQGQSWGGYQAGYIITKTDLFSAASIGAPVSNMTSAYGGIRWASGMSRMFQYEKTQSRIGGTLWEKPLHYIENSPVFYAPRINTPVLIRHNDGDGAVPWYQGIEYFVALRRLNKPVWMLNYNGQPHNEKNKSPNTKDLSIRMMQFFNHYLKGEPAPDWMKYGIPAIQKGKTLGY